MSQNIAHAPIAEIVLKKQSLPAKARDTFSAERARVEEAAATQLYRYEYMAALEIIGVDGPRWENLSILQRAMLQAVITVADRYSISLRIALRSRN